MGKHSEDSTPTITLCTLINYMLRYSCEERRVSVNEIAVGLTAITEYCCTCNINISDLTDEDYDKIDVSLSGVVKYDPYQFSKSIKKQIIRLLKRYSNQNTILGIKIIKGKTNKSDSNAQVYYAKLPLNTIHINLIEDLLSGYPFAEVKETKRILKVLNSFKSIYYSRNRAAEIEAERYMGTFYDNLKEITKALSRVKPMKENSYLTKAQQGMKFREYEKLYTKNVNKIQFEYCYDEVKSTGNIKSGLIITSPIQLKWVQGLYYLETYDDVHNTFELYRIYRMTDVKCLSEYAILPN